METHKIYKMSFARVYSLYIKKVERKGRTKEEVDAIIAWMTGYKGRTLTSVLKKGTDFETFFAEAPKRKLITGVVCGIRVEEVKEPLMQEIRYMDKLIDELAKGRAMGKILRTEK